MIAPGNAKLKAEVAVNSLFIPRAGFFEILLRLCRIIRIWIVGVNSYGPALSHSWWIFVCSSIIIYVGSQFAVESSFWLASEGCV